MKYALRIFSRNAERTRSGCLDDSRQRQEQRARSETVTQAREMVDAAVIAYADWRAACTAVRDAYGGWEHALASDAELAFRAYGAALDREQAAADVYAGLMSKVGHLVESGLDYPLNATTGGVE